MNVIKEITKNRFLLLLMDEEEYDRKLGKIIKSLEKTKTNICYVCFSVPYQHVVERLKEKGTDIKRFFFIDVLSSHYSKPKPQKNCIFISEPKDLDKIRKAILKTVIQKNCSIIIFDTISSLLVYQESYSILKFTHNLIISKEQENTKKIFIVLKDKTLKEEGEMLIKDLSLFADKLLKIKK